jgi:predicted metal-dependent phosphoesterase TrpH
MQLATTTGEAAVVKVDLHSHTRYSRDSVMTPAQLVARARAVGLHRVAVTDHNTIDGAHAASAIDPSLIIIGQEIDTRERTHLIGLFLHERIPPGLPVRETAERIRAQGGAVYAPHPYAYLSEPTRHAEEAIGVADVVEVFNSRAFLPIWNRRALRAAEARQLPAAAGSDSHFSYEIGAAWTELPEFHTADEFRQALRLARAVGRRTQSPFVHVASAAIQMGKRTAQRLRGRRRADMKPVPGELESAGL